MLLNLPTEVVVETLTWLDCQSLLECRGVCGSLRDVIDNESSLQLVLELRKSGLDYTGYGGPRDEVIRRLQQQRRNWKELEWTGKYNHSLEGLCNAYELVDGLFVKTDSDGRILILELPTTQSPSFRVLVDDHIGFQPGDFTLDATQDLIVFIKLEQGTNAAQRTASLRLRSISQLHDHPEASKSSFSFDILAEVVWPHSAHRAITQIAGELLGVFVCSGSSARLVIWNWKTGKQVGDSDQSSFPQSAYSFTFVSPGLFYVTTPVGSIVLYAVDTTGFTHVASLLLPNLQASVFLHTFGCHTEQYRAKRSSRTASTLFRKQLHSFELTCLNQSDFTHHDFRMLAPTSLFINYHELYLKRGIESPVIAIWDEWGPLHTRFQSADTGYRWLRYVHGQRVVMPLEDRELEILDFNVDPESEVAEPTVIPRGRVFEDIVVSRLPYFETNKFLQQDYHGVMIDNDRIVTLSVKDVLEAIIDTVTVFTF